MKNQKFLFFIIYALLILILAALLGYAIYSFVVGEYAAGGVLLVLFALGLLACIGVVLQRKFNRKCTELFLAKKFDEERLLIEKKMKGPFYFFVRIAAMQHYIFTCAALDDLVTAKRYIDRLRHGGGKGWKYHTAYLYILIKLDEGDVQTARAEYDDFRRDCKDAVVYQQQLEVLKAIFQRLFSLRNAAPLPESAIESSYPVVSRILGKHFEESAEEWKE